MVLNELKMSNREQIKVIGEEPAIGNNRSHTTSHSANHTRARSTRWSRIRELFIPSRNMERPVKIVADECCDCMGEHEARSARSWRSRRHSDKAITGTTRVRARTLSWLSFKDRFRKLRSRMHHSTSSLTPDSSITIDRDGHECEDSPVLPREENCQCDISNHDTAGDFLFLKAPSKQYESWIPKMIYKVINCPWYWGNIDRFEAAVALQTKADGYFLLRKSAQPEYLFTISFRRFNKTMHVRIERGYGPSAYMESIMLPWFATGEVSPTYAKLLELIEHFCEPTAEGFGSLPLLLHPLHRTTPFTLKDLARAAVYKWCNYYSYAFYKIDSLEIPEELKLYLKEFGYTQNIFEYNDYLGLE